VIRWLGPLTAELSGSDYNDKLADWCRRNIDFAEFRTNDLAPPLAFEDEQFDLVYSFSVFTHLTGDLQQAWLVELHRVLKPGGYLFVTLHGENFLQNRTEEEAAQVRKGELLVLNEDHAGTNMCGAIQTERFVREHWCDAFEFIDAEAEGATASGNQDAYLLRKNSRSGTWSGLSV
jgi:SAM-dependent methyltransferase